MVSEPLSDRSLAGDSIDIDREEIQVKVAAPKFNKAKVVTKDLETVRIQPQPRKVDVKNALPDPPAPPMGRPMYQSGNIGAKEVKMEPQLLFSHDGKMGGWKFTRLANSDITMRPASDFETFEDIVRRLGQSAKWRDQDPPPIPVSGDYPVEYRDPEDAGENDKAECVLFKPPPGKTDPMDPNDIHQGELGDCWFMAAASTVAAYDELDERWLGRYDQEKGVYEFIFYNEIDFSERRVCVDRRIPLKVLPELPPDSYYTDGHPGNIRFKYCRSDTPGELWPSLLEKAFAKVYGGYENIDGGLSAIGVANLTRGVPFVFSHGSSSGIPASADHLWRKLVELWNDGYVLGVSFKEAPSGTGGPCGEPPGFFGLISGHAYGVLGLYKSRSTGLRFVKIRNPHATNEWKGPWSDDSQEIKDNPRCWRRRKAPLGTTDYSTSPWRTWRRTARISRAWTAS